MIIDEKKRDILLAGAIGDAVGYVVEFTKLSQIQKTYGPNGLTLDLIHPDAPLTVSDDTQMTLFTLEALHTLPYEADTRDIEWTFYTSFMQWLYTQHNPAGKELTSPLARFSSMQVQRAPGMTCLGALNKKLPRPNPINESKGCGGIMRAAPCGFLASQDSAIAYGVWQARVTHGHPSGYLSAGYFAGLIWCIENGLSLDHAIVSCNKDIAKFNGSDETLDIVHRAQQTAKRSTGDFYSDVRYLGEGWTGEEALAIAIYAVYVAKNFEHLIQISINHDGDSDSTGSLAAQLWASLYGLPRQYRDWEKRLDIADAFEFALDENNYINEYV